jgi:hypothetical protein
MLMGPGLAAGLAFPAAGDEEEAGASPSACLPGTSGALRSLINDLSTFFSLPKPAPLMSPSNAAVFGAPPPPPTAEGGGGGGGGPPPLEGGGGGGFGALEGGGGGGGPPPAGGGGGGGLEADEGGGGGGFGCDC